MNRVRLIVPSLALQALVLTTVAHAQYSSPQPSQQNYPQQQQQNYPQQQQNYPQQQGNYPQQGGYAQQQGGYDAPPAEFSDDLRRQAFHDGISAARHDFQAHLPLDPASHPEFRHPQVPFPSRDNYRDAYKRGYSIAAQHLQGGGDPPVAPPPPQQGGVQGLLGGIFEPPAEFNDDLRRNAFHDGAEAARRDFQAHLPLDPATHQEFRHPQVPFPARDNYRDAYRRGYTVATQRLQGGGGPGYGPR